jgi:Dolichyl-phosphate-mannose-protein mannosyltransferase
LPALVLLLFLAFEALVKSYIRSSLHPIVLAGMALCVIYFSYYFRTNGRAADLWERFHTPAPRIRWSAFIATAIILLGVFLRVWHLGSLFDGMTYDEAYKGLDAIAIREFHERPIFLDWNGGREALVAYLVAASQTIFNYSIVSVRIVTALAGSLSLLFIYLFARTVFNNHIALVTTFLMAVSKWHIIHSRYGVRAGLYPLFEIATLYFLVRGLYSDQKRWGSLLAAGIIGALGFYTYIAYRVFPIVVIAFLAEKVIRTNLSKHLKPLIAALVISIIIVAPLAKFFIEHKESLSDRMRRTQVWSQKGKENISPLKLIVASAGRTFGMFTFKGDEIARHNVDQEPMLSPFSTPFFILGLLLVILNFRKPYTIFLLVYFFFTLLPGILSVGAPNVPRCFGALPVAMLFTSFGVYGAAGIVLLYSKMLTKLLWALFLGGNLVTGVLDSMIRYPAILDSLSPKIAALWGMDRDQRNVAKLINQLGNGCEVYLSPMFFFHSTVEYLTYSKSRHSLSTPFSNLKKTPSEQKVIVVVLQPHEVNPWWLRDDEGKFFYKWWNQVYHMTTPEIRSIVRRSYDPPLTKTSDWRLVNKIRSEHPEARELRFESFNVFVFKVERPRSGH